jgi:N-acetylmuramoyl-L-alanine amidase
VRSENGLWIIEVAKSHLSQKQPWAKVSDHANGKMAVNGSYWWLHDKPPVSFVGDKGRTVYHDGAYLPNGEKVYWPYIAVRVDGTCWFGEGSKEPNEPAEGTYEWAIGGGPRYSNGKVVGWNASLPPVNALAFRTAIGVRNGHITLVVGQSKMTMTDFATRLNAVGISEALNLDGGGSTTLYDGQKYLVGGGREIPNAIIVDEEATSERKFRVFIDRSDQWNNTDTAPAYGGRVRYGEGWIMQMYALALAEELTKRDCEVMLSDSEEHDLIKIAEAANAWGADIVLSKHSNAEPTPITGKARGAMPIICAKGGRAEKMANIIARHMKEVCTVRPLLVQQDIILVKTDAPAVEVELGFHTNDADLLMLLSRSFLGAVTQKLADAVDEYRKG